MLGTTRLLSFAICADIHARAQGGFLPMNHESLCPAIDLFAQLADETQVLNVEEHDKIAIFNQIIWCPPERADAFLLTVDRGLKKCSEAILAKATYLTGMIRGKKDLKEHWPASAVVRFTGLVASWLRHFEQLLKFFLLFEILLDHAPKDLSLMQDANRDLINFFRRGYCGLICSGYGAVREMRKGYEFGEFPDDDIQDTFELFTLLHDTNTRNLGLAPVSFVVSGSPSQ